MRVKRVKRVVRVTWLLEAEKFVLVDEVGGRVAASEVERCWPGWLAGLLRSGPPLLQEPTEGAQAL